LNLTDDQKEKLKPTLREEGEKLQAVREDSAAHPGTKSSQSEGRPQSVRTQNRVHFDARAESKVEADE